MGQQLFKVNFDAIRSCCEKDNITFVFPWKIKNLLKSSIETENVLIKQIRNHLFQLTNSKDLKEIDVQINEILTQNVFSFIDNNYQKAMKEITETLEKQQQLQTSLINKFKQEEHQKSSIFASNDNEQKVSCFGIQSLISILLILIKSVEKSDPTLIDQILSLTTQLSEQIPMRSLSSFNNQTLLVKSLKPLINYIEQLSLSEDSILSKQATKILLNLSIAKASFKDILPLLSKLIFDTNNIYDCRSLIIHLNNDLTKIMQQKDDQNTTSKESTDEISLASLDYLKRIEAFPNTKLMELDEKQFTGQFLSSIILSHIHFDNEFDSNKQIKQNLLNDSFSFKFHPDIFRQLFDIIKQFTLIQTFDSNPVPLYILTVCIKLSRTHLEFLSYVTTDLYQNLFGSNDASQSTNQIDFVSNEELTQWFELFLNLSSHDDQMICQEASETFVYIIDKQSKSFIEKLSYIHRYIIQNENEILVKEFLLKLNRAVILLNWIEVLSKNNSDKSRALDILYSLVDIYLNRNDKQIEQILLSFQHLLLFRLIEQSRKQNDDQDISINLISSLIIDYISYIFNKCPSENELLKEILVGLSLMTKTDQIFHFTIIEPIFTAALPLLSEYFFKNPTNNPQFVCWLLGKLSQLMIINFPLNSLEKSNFDQLNSVIFSGGYQRSEIESSSDNQLLLLSIFNNTNSGARLISKMQMSLKSNQYFLQKSIEEQANDASAFIFAVYIKYYRRINLLKYNFSRSDDEKVDQHLLTLYKYAHSVQRLFANLKAQGGNCHEFYQKIKNRSLFLLLSIKENDFIPIIEQDFQEKKEDKFHFQRQISRWTKAKYVIRLLRNLMNACIRFKQSILQKNKIVNEENTLRQAIDHFIYGTNQIDLEQLIKCLQRQNQRADIRLFTYQFIQTFIQKICQLDNQNELIIFYLSQLENCRLEWSYLENIPTGNDQLKKDIRKCYYSIIQIVLSYLIKYQKFQSEILIKNLFNLLNLNYQSDDIISLYDYQIIEILLKSFVSFTRNSEQKISLNSKFIAFNWFRLFTLKISENIHIDQILHHQRDSIFNQFILNQLKELKQIVPNQTNDENSINSLENVTIGWFIHATTIENSNQFSSRLEIELCINQFLVLLLECMHLYEDVRSICANMDYIKQLLDIYYQSKNNSTVLLSLKILGQLISYFPNNSNEISNNIIEKFLIDSLVLIGQTSISEQTLINELINMYRLIISRKSSWQIIATQFVFNSINLTLNENLTQTNDINKLIASLAILGGYIHPFCLASVVKVFNNKQTPDKFQLAIIIDINKNERSSYIVQYFETNQIETVTNDQLQIEVDISPPNLLLLPNANELIDSIFDKLAEFIQIGTNSYLLLQIKRRSISVLYHLLNNQQLIQIFMQKPYASIIAKLTMSNSIPQPINNTSTKTNEENFSSVQINRDENIVDCLSTSLWKYNGWKAYTSKTEFHLFNQGRSGNNQMLIVPIPHDAVKAEVLEECGNKHRFKGKICSTSDNTSSRFPTFILQNVRVNQGKWYFCVKLPVGGVVQIGWATDGFSPGGDNGIGDDFYSWSYDGSRAVLFHNQQYSDQFNNIRWKENDVCGCGIEINGQNINIKYWLNGKLLGTPFHHQQNIPSSTTKCNLLPNGPTTTYFPGVSLQLYSDSLSSCQFIFSPEDMEDCPLPDGYKPLLMPEITNIENSIVPYPYSAYLIGDNMQDYFYTTRTTTSNTFLRDFVNQCHLQTEFNLHENQLILPKNSFGFPLSINNDVSSFTITFHLQIQTHEQNDIQLFTFDTAENFSIRMPFEKTEKKTQTVIVFDLKEQQVKVYLNNKCQIFDIKLENETISKFHFHLLPKIDGTISDLAIWKYALSEEHIQRLFTYGLFYVSIDYQQLKEHQKRMKTFSFTKNEFESELLIPFDQPFEEDLWQKKKKQPDQNESKYLKSSIIQLYGNQTYLVLDKSNDQWLEYTLIIDILIPNWSMNNDQQLSLIKFNSEAQLFVTKDGKLALQNNQTKNESHSSVILNEFIRLFISVQQKSVQIYLNGSLEIDVTVDDDRFAAKLNHIHLFRETDLTKNTTNEDILRIQCQSITFINRFISIHDLHQDIKLPNSSLETLIAPDFSLIASNLIAIGYKESWINSAIKLYQITNIQMIDTIIRQQKQQFINIDLENERIRYLNIFSRLYPMIDRQKLDHWLIHTVLDIDEQIQFILTHRKDFQITNQISEENDSSNNNENVSKENKWFSEIVHQLDIQHNINQWIRDKSTMVKPLEYITSVINTNRTRRVTHWFDDDDDDNEDTPESIDFSYMILPSRQAETESNSSGNANCRERIVYKLVELNRSEHNQRKSIQESIECSLKQFLNSPIAGEHALITTYARYLIENMLNIWSNNSISLFPLDKFGDYPFVITLLRILDYHFIYTNSHTDEHIDQINFLIKSILNYQIQKINENKITLLENKAPLVFHLQNNILIQLIRFLLEPSLLNENFDNETIPDEHILIKEPNLNFVFKILNIFVDLVKDKSILKQHETDQIVQILFPEFLVNLLFDLFLLLSTHQSKIFILHLFSTLIQISEDFILKIQVQNFLFKLVIHLSSNLSLTKHFQIAVMDLVFLLLMRGRKQEISFQRTELPENVQNLFTAIDVINAFNDQTKQNLISDAFFAQLEDISNDGTKLNRNDFEKCNKYFDKVADQQLISFLNSKLSPENSFTAFIQSLPNSTYYEKYPALSNIPTDCIQLRSGFLYHLNIFLIKVLPMVNLNLLSGQSILTDQIRTAKIYLLHQTKLELLHESLEKTAVKYAGKTLQVSFDTIKASDSKENDKNTMFHQAYHQLYSNAHIHFRRKVSQIWQTIYVGMHSIDQGGPYRDSITQICSDICSTRLPLFILCPNGRTNSGSNRDCWIPNVFPPNKFIPDEFKKQYQFIGQLMGLAIRKKHYLDFKFPLLLWKQLLREDITIEDIQAIDIQSFTSINEIEKNIEQTLSTDASVDINDLFSSIISELRFEVVSSAGQTYELIPGGMNIPITSHNFKRYSSCYRQYRLDEFHRQIEFIRQGLCNVVPFDFLSLFTANELEEAVCGKGEIDIELLKRNTQYSGSYDQDSPHIQRFWTVFSEMFDNEQKKLFLTFVWGRNTLPSRDQDFNMKFTINEYYVDDGDVDKTLPQSHTCTFAIDLPEYSTTDIMYERLNYAITYCSSIDGDGNFTGELQILNFFSDFDE